MSHLKAIGGRLFGLAKFTAWVALPICNSGCDNNHGFDNRSVSIISPSVNTKLVGCVVENVGKLTRSDCEKQGRMDG